MDANHYSYTSHGAFNPYDQSLDFISEDFLTNELSKSTPTILENPLDVSARKPPRQQRTKSQGTEHVKHRRSRLGCLVCRSRRVKCDMDVAATGTCERCRKGNRQCHWPSQGPNASKAKSKQSSSPKEKESPSGSSSDDVNNESTPVLDNSTIDGEDNASVATAATSTHPHDLGISTKTPPTTSTTNTTRIIPIKDQHTSSNNANSTQLSSRPSFNLQQYNNFNNESSEITPYTFSGPESDVSRYAFVNSDEFIQFPANSESFPRRFDLESMPVWKTLSADDKFYLQYHRDHLGHFHYAFKHDPRHFLKTDLLYHASNYRPLLIALIAFSCYHYTLRQPNSRAKRFLTYYDQAVTLFRQSLASGYRHPVETILTMLQLATIEEFLGDWVNLLGHQRAARQMIAQLHTPQEMASLSYTHRVILVYYWRFDLYAGVMSGGAPTLDRSFFRACTDYCEVQTELNPDDIAAAFDHFFTYSRMLATDTTILFESRRRGTIQPADFQYQYRALQEKANIFNRKVESAYRDVPYFTKRWKRLPGPDTLTEFNDEHFMFNGPFFPMNYILIDTWAANLVMCHEVAKMEAEANGQTHFTRTPRMLELALKKCKMLECIQYSEETPPGAVLCCQASLSIAALFVPDEPRYHDWMREKFALLESNGYIYPPSMRKRMGEMWNVDVSDWWLPNGQGRPPMVKTLREFVNFRASEEAKLDDREVNVRDLNGIFHSMQLAGRRDLLQELGAEEQVMLDEPAYIPQ